MDVIHDVESIDAQLEVNLSLNVRCARPFGRNKSRFWFIILFTCQSPRDCAQKRERTKQWISTRRQRRAFINVPESRNKAPRALRYSSSFFSKKFSIYSAHRKLDIPVFWNAIAHSFRLSCLLELLHRLSTTACIYNLYERVKVYRYLLQKKTTIWPQFMCVPSVTTSFLFDMNVILTVCFVNFFPGQSQRTLENRLHLDNSDLGAKTPLSRTRLRLMHLICICASGI